MKSTGARWRAHRTLGATRRTLTNRNFLSFCGGPNPCPLDQSGQAKHHHFDPRKQTPDGRHQIGTPAGFKSESVAGFLLECVAGFVGIRKGSTVALQQARERYEALLKDDLFDRAKRLRNDVVAHNLIPDTPTPKVHYEDVYDLRDAAERIVTDLFAACVRDKPNCLALRAGTDEQAKLFWDTYERGTVNAAAARPW